ncbi:MAG: hypothetical protein ABI445_00790 [Polyangia bacterium]
MILLRTSGVDNNSAGASQFVAIPLPVGIQDGDLIVVAVAVDNAGISITPPDAGWIKAFRTDPSRGVSIAVYYKTAINEFERWVFTLSSSANAQGVAAVYSGADGWHPVEFVSAAATLASASQAVGATQTSLDAEQLVLFVCTDAVSTLTAPAGYLTAQTRQNVGTLALMQQQRASAGLVPASTVSTTGTPNGASLLIILRPSASTVSVSEARELFVQKLPADVDRVYDLDAGGDYYKLFQSVAMLAKETAYDLIDLLRLEVLPRFAIYKLPDWERVFGLTTTRNAQRGTIPQRQAQVVASWREAAGLGSTRAAITAILGPLLGYNAATPVQVSVTDRDLLRIAHSYSPTAAIPIRGGTFVDYKFSTVDGGVVSSAGLRVALEYSSSPGESLTVTLTGPDGYAKEWDPVVTTQALDWLFGPEFAGKNISGRWTLEIFNNAASGTVYVHPTIFVEGVPKNFNENVYGQATGASIFEWGAFADPAHMGENGTPADLAAVRRAVQRIAFSQTVGNVLQSLVASPDVDAGAHAAIPDECIPT